MNLKIKEKKRGLFEWRVGAKIMKIKQKTTDLQKKLIKNTKKPKILIKFLRI